MKTSSAIVLPLLLLWPALLVRAGAREDGSSDPSADFFSRLAIHTFKIEIDEAGIASLKAQRRTYVLATVTADGVVYHEVAVRVKGGPGSLRNLDDKPALTLNFKKFKDAQRFSGMRKIHLNNSAQDRSCVNEVLAGELFRAAGVPAPRTAHALVELNGKKRGLYVLREGFGKDFLARYFKDTGGNLYDPGPAPSKANDVAQPMARTSGDGPDDWSDLKAVAAAVEEPDLSRRWQRLEKLLDMERVLSFMAMEIMASHVDGYCLVVANYRIYHDADTDRILFFPHGMDQMFESAQMPIEPNMRGSVAQAILKTPEGRRRYRERFRQLFTEVFKVEALNRRLDELSALLRPALLADNPNAAARFETAVARKRKQIAQRAASLEKQLALRDSRELRFDKGTARLTVWTTRDDRGDAQMKEGPDPAGKQALRISARGPITASWRTRVVLDASRYRFEGRARTASVVPRGAGREEGAALRISGNRRAASKRLSSDTPWQDLACEFEVPSPSAEVELVCELRAGKGEAWFESESLRLVRVE